MIAHHDLYQKTGILHRDISINNLMVDARNPAQGVLIDLDIAARVDTNGDPLDQDILPPAGTLEFRASELVRLEKPVKSYYRHDLESFMYVLFWIQTHYKDGKMVPNASASHLGFNFHLNWNATREQKQGFLVSRTNKLPPSSLRDCWLVPLRELFAEADRARRRDEASMRLADAPKIEAATRGGLVTLEAFTNILKS